MGLLEQKLNLKLTQKLALTPALQQAIKLLQMTVPELRNEIREELLKNPLLEDVASSNSPEEGEKSTQKDEKTEQSKDELHSNEINVEDYFRDYLDDEYIPSFKYSEDRDNDYSYENYLSENETLQEHLVWQANMNINDDAVLDVVLDLIQYIDDDGYLIRPDREDINVDQWLSEELNISENRIREGIHILQTFDPSGVGARNLKECLIVQSENLGFGNDRTLSEIINHFLPAIAEKEYGRIANEMSLELDDVIVYVDFIKKLEPKPGRRFTSEKTVYVTPDVYVKKVGNDYQVQLNDDGLPHLRVNRALASIVTSEKKKSEEKETVDYIKDKFKSAVWIIKSIQNRQRTILKVSKSIVKHQRAFLDFGIEHMKPLTLKDVAEDIGMHESTVARVVKNKYMHTPRGLFEKKFFFTSKLSSDSGSDVSSLAVKEKLRKIVETENMKKPYSDNAIVSILKSHGINIARRTVAKYREEIGILSSSERKKNYRRSYEN